MQKVVHLSAAGVYLRLSQSVVTITLPAVSNQPAELSADGNAWQCLTSTATTHDASPVYLINMRSRLKPEPSRTVTQLPAKQPRRRQSRDTAPI